MPCQPADSVFFRISPLHKQYFHFVRISLSFCLDFWSDPILMLTLPRGRIMECRDDHDRDSDLSRPGLDHDHFSTRIHLFFQPNSRLILLPNQVPRRRRMRRISDIFWGWSPYWRHEKERAKSIFIYIHIFVIGLLRQRWRERDPIFFPISPRRALIMSLSSEREANYVKETIV